jgi:sulfatase maturation enzyme AslB (radical SAM superfamily)
MSIETIDKIEKFIKENIDDYETKTLMFFGGEPTLHFEAIKEFVKRFPKNKYFASTNGIVYDPEIAGFFKKLFPQFILQVSIDGMPTGERTDVETETKIINNYKRYASDMDMVYVYSVISPSRVKHLKEDIKFLAEIGCRSVSHRFLDDISQFSDEHIVEIEKQLTEAAEWYMTVGLKNNAHFNIFHALYRGQESPFKCSAGIQDLNIDPVGNINACNCMAAVGIKGMGNISDPQEFIKNYTEWGRTNVTCNTLDKIRAVNNLFCYAADSKQADTQAKKIAKILYVVGNQVYNYIQENYPEKHARFLQTFGR